MLCKLRSLSFTNYHMSLTLACALQLFRVGLQVQDKIGFLINNLSNSNLGQKASDVKEVLTEQYWPWFCNYMVVKRAAQEQNFHLLYATLLQELQVGSLLVRIEEYGGAVYVCSS